jgi:uncharacterized membrane protein
MNGSRAWIIALAVSAAINVFLIGGVAGMAFVRLTAPAPASPPPTMSGVSPRPAPEARPAPSTAPVAQTPRAPAQAARPSSAPAAGAPTIASGEAEPGAGRPRPPLISAGEALSPESRRAFRRALSEANRRNRPIIQQARAERQAALAALTSASYDPAEVSRRLATARNLDQQARANVEAALATFTASLSPQERAVLAEGLIKVYAPRAVRRAMQGSN